VQRRTATRVATLTSSHVSWLKKLRQTADRRPLASGGGGKFLVHIWHDPPAVRHTTYGVCPALSICQWFCVGMVENHSQMAMSQDKCPQLKPSHVHHSITGMIVHNDPGGAFFVQGSAPLPVFWAPMPLPGLLQTSSSFADGMRAALARSEGSGAIFVFSSFCGCRCIEKGAASPTPANPRPLQLPTVRRNMRERLPWAANMLH
jgi:hypothetical protein